MIFCMTIPVFGMNQDPLALIPILAPIFGANDRWLFGDGFIEDTLDQAQDQVDLEKLVEAAKKLPCKNYDAHACLSMIKRSHGDLCFLIEDYRREKKDRFDDLVGLNNFSANIVNRSRKSLVGACELLQNFMIKTEELEKTNNDLDSLLKKQEAEAMANNQQLNELKKLKEDDCFKLRKERLFFKRAFICSAFSALVLFAYILYDKYI